MISVKSKLFKIGISVGFLAAGVFLLGKKTGLLENDAYLYDEYDTSK